jgi:nucleotide-binding universal stress UspA family protein
MRRACLKGQNVEDNLFNKMLLVVDGSEPSIAAANYAVHLAKQSDGHITAMYVVDTATMEYLMQMRIFVDEERQEFERDLEQTGKRYLDYVRQIGENHGIEVETMQKRGSFHQSILDQARAMNADVIILGGWRRSITSKDTTSVERQLILDETELPVIIVKQRREG